MIKKILVVVGIVSAFILPNLSHADNFSVIQNYTQQVKKKTAPYTRYVKAAEFHYPDIRKQQTLKAAVGCQMCERDAFIEGIYDDWRIARKRCINEMKENSFECDEFKDQFNVLYADLDLETNITTDPTAFSNYNALAVMIIDEYIFQKMNMRNVLFGNADKSAHCSFVAVQVEEYSCTFFGLVEDNVDPVANNPGAGGGIGDSIVQGELNYDPACPIAPKPSAIDDEAEPESPDEGAKEQEKETTDTGEKEKKEKTDDKETKKGKDQPSGASTDGVPPYNPPKPQGPDLDTDPLPEKPKPKVPSSPIIWKPSGGGYWVDEDGYPVGPGKAGGSGTHETGSFKGPFVNFKMNFRPVPDNEIFYTKLEPVCGNKSQSAFMNCSVAEGDKSIHDNAPILCMQSDPSCIDSAPPGSTVLVPSIDEDWCADFLIHGGDIDWGDQGPPPSDDDVDEDDNGCMGSFGAGGNGPAPFYPNPEGPGAGDDCGPKPITPMMKMEKAINPGSMDNRHIMREVQRGQTR